MSRTKLIVSVAIIVIAAGTIYFQGNKIQALKKERDVYLSNTNSLLSKQKTYRIDSVSMATEVQSLQFTVSEYKNYRVDDMEIIDKLNIKIKRLESSSTQKMKIEADIVSSITDSTIITDSIISTIQKVSMNNSHIHFNGTIQNDSLTAKINIPITLRQYVYYTPKHRFLWFRWGIGDVRQIITTDNPYVTIEYTEYIKLR